MAHIAARALPPVASKARSVVADHLARENVGPLESYVPLMAGERAEPATVTSASTDVRGAWTATVPADPRAIIDYYRSPVHHPGWFLEFDSSTMLVFRRPITALAVRGTERVRVRVETPVVSTVSHPHHDTYVEYVITRRF
jgi:hypothetical protein